MLFVLNSKSKVQSEFFKEKIEATQLTLRSFKIIKEAVDSLNIPIDRINDPNETGLIGLQYSPITIERGDLNAKLTSTNPNFAALIVKFLKDAGARNGDVVAVSFTGSYPALNIAVLSALEILQLNPVIITSVGSSMWGANYPQFTYLDMEKILNIKDVIEFRTTAASIGGKDDIGRGLSPEGRENIKATINRNNVQILEIANIDDAINKRLNIYNNRADSKLLINVGEQPTPLVGADIDIGIIKPRQVKSGKGIIAQFSQSGKPVINLVDINRLAEKYKLPLAPIPLPSVGEGPLYYTIRYSVSKAIISLVVLSIILFVVLRYDIDYYLKRREDD